MALPIGLASARTHPSAHRLQRIKLPVRADRPAKHTRRRHGRRPGNTKPTLILGVSRTSGWSHTRRHRRRVAHLAGDPSDTISDFKFAPASITIHVGDTITWTNNGPTEHTATATNGSFDTGLLKKGQSASHTFTQAGTFAYICSIHPFMHGTVVVVGNSSSGSSSGSGLGSATSSGSGSGTPSSTGSTASASTPSSAATLPNTGLNIAATLGTALLLLALGTVLSRRSRHQD